MTPLLFVVTLLTVPFIGRSERVQGIKNGIVSSSIGRDDHPCNRECLPGNAQVCQYTFSVNDYATMSEACGNCPQNVTDCYAEGCITAGGYVRTVQVINYRLPGTPIEVCLGDTVIVRMQNKMSIDATTIHWHGEHQKVSPHMDGVPFLTQCPVLPNNEFEYNFVTDVPGTHIYHSHVGFEDAEGMHGAFIVRRPKGSDPNGQTYDFDLSEHTAVIWHWTINSAKETFNLGRFQNSRVLGNQLLINGKGTGVELIIEGVPYYAPREVFTVTQGSKYRFRIIFNTAVNCPVQLSIDNHPLLVIASDAGSFEPIEVQSVMINAGERFDFVLDANQPVDNYWFRLRGTSACESTEIHQEAILRYAGAPAESPQGTPTYQEAIVPGRLLNPIGVLSNNFSQNELILLTRLNGTETKKVDEDVVGDATRIHYLKLTMNRYGTLQAPGPYPQINDNTFRAPPFPFLTQRDQITPDMFCTDANKGDYCNQDNFCSCTYVLEAVLGDLVEIIIVDPAATGSDHPFHLHGFAFNVVAMDLMPESNRTVEYVRYLNEMGLIQKKLVGAVVKDTVSVPVGGYVVIRFYANNPGFWFFHCHIGLHAEMGMATVLKVGDVSQMAPVPADFPKCGNFPSANL